MRLAVVFVCTVTFVSLVRAEDPDAPAASDAAPLMQTHTPAAPSFDWVPRAQLAPEVVRALPEYCEGAYVEPSYPLPRNVDSATLPIETQAQNLEYWLNDRAELTGGGVVTRGNQSVSMSRGTFHQDTQIVDIEGGLTLREPGLLVYGESGEVSLNSGDASISNAQFVLQPKKLRGDAETLERNSAGDLRALRGSFTRCEPGNDNWRLTSSDVRVEHDAKFGTARNAVLRVRDFPVLYTPYIRFPVTDERMSGWLFPDLGYSNENGADIAAPYYLNLAPNYDATVTPRYIAERGVGLQANTRYLSSHSRTEVGGAYLYHDDDYNGEVSRADFDAAATPGKFDPADRWLITSIHNGDFGGFRTRVDYAKVSDLDYFRDLGNSLQVTSQVELQQLAELRYQRDNLSMALWVQDFQPLDNDGLEPYRRLPALDLSYGGRSLGPFNLSIASGWADFDRPNTNLVGIQKINGKRLDLEPRVLLPLDAPYGFLHFLGGYRYTKYNLDDVPVGADAEPERKIWLGSMDGGLFFERDSDFLGVSMIQTLEPRLFYLYQQYQNQNELPQFDVTQLDFTYPQLFRDNRFAGIDRLADAKQLTAALTTRVLNATGQERLRLSVGQIIYFEDRQVTISGTPTSADQHSRSPFAGSMGVTLGTDFTFATSATYDPNDDNWDELSVGLQYRRDNRHIVNVGFRRRDDLSPLLRQSDQSVYWAVFRNWSVIGRFNYDWEESRTIDAMAGLEYSDCCWQIRLVGQRFLDQPGAVQTTHPEDEKGIYLQVVFKGLAGFGGRIDSMMERSIPGYRVEEF